MSKAKSDKPEAAQEPPIEFPKPVVVNMDELTLGDVEILESMLEMQREGKSPSIKFLFELFTRLLEGWTIEDCRKLKLKQIGALKTALMNAFTLTVPN